MLKIERYKHKHFDNVKTYLKNNHNATPFHSIEWSNLVSENYSHDNETLIASENGNICGMLSLSHIKIPFQNNYLASGPFGSHCEILGDNSFIKYELLQYAVNLSRELKVKYLEIKNIDDLFNEIKEQQFFEASKIVRGNSQYCTMKLECESEEYNWKNLSKTLRNEIRNAQKKGLKVSVSKDKVNSFYELLSKTMHRHGTPIHSFKFYDDIINKIDNSEIINVELNGKIIASNLLIGLNNTLHSLASASDENFWNSKPNQFLWWECIKYAMKNKYKYLDFGRSKISQGTYFFKSKFGAKPINLNYIYYLNNITSAPDISEENIKFKFATSVWKFLPVFLTKKIGHFLIRYVS